MIPNELKIETQDINLKTIPGEFTIKMLILSVCLGAYRTTRFEKKIKLKIVVA
jgi:hypothetical protein